jgi:CYTH domain-containing protein
MSLEIERKFLVKKMPSLEGKTPVRQERYYLFAENGIELRIQSKGDLYELERKTAAGDYSRTSQKTVLSKAEFDVLKKIGKDKTIRDSYTVSKNPIVKLKIYHGAHEGLVRAEVEFESAQTARAFKPFDWMGAEISDTPLGHDQELGKLDPEQVKKMITRFKSQTNNI